MIKSVAIPFSSFFESGMMSEVELILSDIERDVEGLKELVFRPMASAYVDWISEQLGVGLKLERVLSSEIDGCVFDEILVNLDDGELNKMYPLAVSSNDTIEAALWSICSDYFDDEYCLASNMVNEWLQDSGAITSFEIVKEATNET